ncbi:uncharacterized protein LOC126563868 [Anopheles maculipalpis]|uniref:uncharacterized protein LOC126563868 n=1 Tax=Anopheles maculipalpis TaxID=1496333 RepID=UPI0021593721|nr:uncharacterized protein LOC126563868 [Anopheles maculipalpis]
MREPIATAPALAAGNVVAPSTAATMFGITNAQIVQSFNGLPPLQGDCPPVGQPCIVRTVSRASSIGGAGTLSSLKSIGGSGASSPVTSVKRNSSSSSFSSGSERRSVFYTDPEQSSTTKAEEKYDVMTNDDSCSTSDACSALLGTVNDADKVRRPRGVQKDQRGEPKDDSALRRLDNGQVRRKQRPCSSSVLDGVIGPKTHLKLVSQELEWERKFRDDQLSRILKALIAFETRLKNEQSRIKQQLYEKDDVINRQNCTINRMKRKLAADEATAGGSDGEEPTATGVDEVAQYCPKCRKNYYRLECRTSGTQTFEYCRDDGAESVNTENLSLNSVEYASSSEEQESSLYVRANSFKDARRSRKYTSKRSYQGYQRGPSRASSFKSSASGPVTGTLAKLVERNARNGARRLSGPREEESGHEAYVNIEPNANVPKIVIYENYESDKENKRMDQNRQECDNNYDNVEPYSNRIDSLHGIHGRSSGRYSNDGQCNPQEQKQQEHQHQHQQRMDGHSDYHPVGSKRSDGSEQMELDDGTIFYEANASAGSVSNQQKYTEGMEMKQTIETNDDWYASASDMEDSDTALGKPYSNAAVNPVLECVNQILLQQSMDGFGDSNKDTTTGEGTAEEELYIKAQQPSPPPVKEPTAVRSKRVHFSTQNSMVQVPRISLQPTTSVSSQGSGSSNRKDDKISPTYEIQSIYSNEYEPIGSEHNSYSNYYVDMESKLGSEDREREQALAEKRKTPPALPPKPANLLKLQQLSKGNHQQRQLVSSPAKGRSTSAQSDIAESEPDYCSISEIQDSVKCVQIVAEIHKDACEDDYSIVDEEEKEKQQQQQQQQQEIVTRGELEELGSKKSCSELEESFADVPKLPNVAEIVPPKKEPLNKFISQDNYITKSSGSSSSKASHSSGAGVAVGVHTPSKKDGEFREQLSEIIAEINKQSPAIRNASKKQIPVKDLSPAFRGVSQIPSVTFQSKLKPVDKLSFLSKTSTAGLSVGSIPSLSHTTPKLSSSIARPSIKPSMLKSSLSTKALSSTNLTLGSGGMNPFGSPVKSVSYIPNLKSPSVNSPLAGSGTASVGCSPIKSSTSTVKKVASAINLANSSTTSVQTSAATVPVIIAEDSKLPIQAEFDWYNLDAEYGKSNQPDVIVEADPSSNGEADGTGDEEDSASCAESPSKMVTKLETTNGVTVTVEDRPSAGVTTVENGASEDCEEEEMENVEYNLDEEYKSLGPIVPPPDIIQKSVHPPITPPKNGKIPYNSLSFKELMQLNETPKIVQEAKAGKPAKTGTGVETVPSGRNYEHFLDDSGLCSKPIILPRKKRVYYSGPFV